MAVQAGLLDDRLPMSVETPDIPGNINKSFTMAGNRMKVQEEGRQLDEAASDRTTLQEYLKGGGDLYTPAGVEKAVGDLKGKVSVDEYGNLIKHAQLAKDTDLKYKDGLTKLSTSELALQGVQSEKTAQMLAQPLDAYNKTKATQGEPAALAEFNKSRDQVMAQLGAQKGANGQPLYPPEFLNTLKDADPSHVQGLINVSKYHQTEIENKLKEAQTEHAKAGTDVQEAEAKLYNSQGGISRAAPSEIAKIDADVRAGRITQEQGESMKAGIVAKKAGTSEGGGMSDGAVHDAGVHYYLTHEFPPGRLSPLERTKIINDAHEEAVRNSDDAESASIRQSLNKSRQLALNDNAKREALIDTYEKDADKRLGLVLELAKKADPGGVPALNRWINAGRQQIEGDVDVNNLNSAMISAQAEVARVMSGALTNAATSDSARAEAAQIMNKYMTMDQLESLVPNIRREFDFKKQAFADERRELTNMMGTPKGQADRAAQDAAKVDPKTQKSRDDQRIPILAKEYMDTQEKLKKFDKKDPATTDARVRMEGDLAAQARELAKLGIKDPAAEAAKHATATPTDPSGAIAPTGPAPTGWKYVGTVK